MTRLGLCQVPPMNHLKGLMFGAALAAFGTLAYLQATDDDPVPVRLIVPTCEAITESGR